MNFCEYHGLNTAIILHSEDYKNEIKSALVSKKEICRCCGRLIDKAWIDPKGYCADCHFNCVKEEEE